MEMTLEEFYFVLKEEEEIRHKCPCCINCKHWYTEYGYELCEIHDIPLENQEEKCNDWR